MPSTARPSFSRLTPSLALACTLGLASLAGAQPVQVKFERVALEEGRSGTVRVLLSTGQGESRPVLLKAAKIELTQAGAPTRQAGGDLVQTIQGLSLESSGADAIPGLTLEDADDEGDRVVSLELRAIDEPGPAARAPMPDLVSTVRGVPHRLVPLLARRTLGLGCQALAGKVTVTISWEAVVVPKETPEGIYALDRVQRWQPEGESRERTGPRKVFRLTTRHWRAWRGEQRAELLLRPKTLRGLPVYRGSTTKTFRVRPAPFGRKAAVAKAGFEPTQAWRLPDDRWILQRTKGSERTFALVGPKMDTVVSGRGDLTQIARDLSEGRSARLHWSTHRGHPDLAVQFKQFYEATYSKSMALTWRIDLVQLRPFLDEVLAAKLEVIGGSLREPRRP